MAIDQLPFREDFLQWLQAKEAQVPPEFTQSSKVDRSKGLADLPLSPEGSAEISQIAKNLGARGTFATVMFSRLLRTAETAAVIAQATHAHLLDITPHSLPWFLGELEGQPVTATLNDLRFYVTNPDQPIAGTGKLSGQPGESFNSFKRRWLGWLRDGPMAGNLAVLHPVAIVTHSHNTKVLLDWVEAGCPQDLSTDNSHILGDSEPPGSVDRLWRPSAEAQWSDDPDSGVGPIAAGIWVIRHGATAWNTQNPQSR